ncbi:MAG: insulinase family protein, partial [Bacteroidetes bacterium]|nr:insulinase family protein [Bacteroidota bacterium]
MNKLQISRLHKIIISFAAIITFSLCSITLLFSQATSGDITKSQLIEKVEAKPGEIKISYEKWQLPNGLTLIMHEDHSDPIALVWITYHVGSAREVPGKSGFAHFFEHMMFQGSKNVADDEHFKIVSESGGENNGFTTDDMTVYFEMLPSNQLEIGLWLEADRMGLLLDSLTKEKFEIQRSTVKNEKQQNQLDPPYGLLNEILLKTLYPAGHPYSWPVIGYVDDLDRAELDDVKKFFLRWYGPNNAILNVSGDIDPEEVLKLTEKYFGPIKRGPEVEKQMPNVPRIPVDKYAKSIDEIFNPLTLMVFPTVPSYHRDEPALILLSEIMGGGKNSLLYKNFVDSEKATTAFIFNSSKELSGEFRLGVIAYNPRMEGALSLDEVEQLMKKTIDDFDKKGITDDELLRAKSIYTSGLISGLQSIFGKSSFLTRWHMYDKKSYNMNEEISRYEKVTKEDVLRVFNKYINNRNAAIVNILPPKPPKPGEERKKFEKKSINPYKDVKSKEDPLFATLKYEPPVDNFDRSIKPKAGESKVPVIPEYYKVNFDNGLKIIGTKTSEIPKIIMIMEIEGGHVLEAGKGTKQGVANFTAIMMGEATQNYTSEEFSAALDRLGSDISFFAGTDNTTIFIESLTENIDETLKLLEEKLLKPNFTPKDFKREKKQLKARIRDQKYSAPTTAIKAFNKLLYGKTILGSYYTGTSKSVALITLNNINEFYENYYSPSVTKLVIVGDISQDEIMPKLDFLKNWKAKKVAVPEFKKEDFPVSKTNQIYLIHKAVTKQTQIRIGYLSLPYDFAGEYYKCNLMNLALGGSFSSRINMNLREKQGFTYGARSYFSGSKNTGRYTVSTSVKFRSTKQAVIEIMNELNKYVDEGITDEELEFTKKSLLNSQVLDYETNYDKAFFLLNILEHD